MRVITSFTHNLSKLIRPITQLSTLSLAFICLTFLASSCSSEDDNVLEPNDCKPIVIDSNFDVDDYTLVSAVDSLSIEGDCLSMLVAFSGCDDDHSIDLITTGDVAESLPPQITFEVVDKNPQICQAFFSKVHREFDLSSLKEIVDEDVRLIFKTYDKEILYQKE